MYFQWYAFTNGNIYFQWYHIINTKSTKKSSNINTTGILKLNLGFCIEFTKKKKRKKRPIHSIIHLSNNGFYDNLNKSIDARKVWSEKQWWLYVTNIHNFLMKYLNFFLYNVEDNADSNIWWFWINTSY